MEALIRHLGIDGRLLVAQIVNFLILLFVLSRFVYRPLLKILRERSKTIEKSLRDAKDLEIEKRRMESERAQIFKNTEREARRLLEATRKEIEQERGEEIEKTKREVSKIMERSKQDLEGEKKRMMEEAEKEVAGLVILASSQLLRENIDSERNRRIVERTLVGLREQ